MPLQKLKHRKPNRDSHGADANYSPTTPTTPESPNASHVSSRLRNVTNETEGDVEQSDNDTNQLHQNLHGMDDSFNQTNGNVNQTNGNVNQTNGNVNHHDDNVDQHDKNVNEPSDTIPTVIINFINCVFVFVSKAPSPPSTPGPFVFRDFTEEEGDQRITAAAIDHPVQDPERQNDRGWTLQAGIWWFLVQILLYCKWLAMKCLNRALESALVNWSARIIQGLIAKVGGRDDI